MATEQKPYIIVLGNEKGGTGKSTVAMHIIVHLLREGRSVGSIDVDARQGTLSRYIENRRLRKESTAEDLPLPDHIPIFRSKLESVPAAEAEETSNFGEALERLKGNDFLVIDTPGSDTYLSRLAHSHADSLITPLNDSFIDLDMLVRVNADSLDILRPSTYSEMVWEQKKQRAMRDNGSIDWIVLRNRLSSLNSRNKEEMEKVLSALSKRIGFRLVAGFGERVIFRELFLNGLTLLDMRETNTALTLSHVAAKQELATLMAMIELPSLRKSKTA
ncbi:MAG: division plane positioning ATPase MipZ [Alphaproteobacteria bacterium]|jgi:chromosome partitioning protein|nr:division plane positioning ATPase MipZ [Alphaproteobacteria bacterium]